MKTIATTAQTEPLPSHGKISLGDATSISLIIAAVSVVIRQAWDWFRSKDQQETDLTKMLIEDLRANKQQLLDGNTKGFQEIVQAIGDLKSSTERMTDAIHNDVQSTLKSQATLYAASNQSLARIEQMIEALHRRDDEMMRLIQSLLERLEETL